MQRHGEAWQDSLRYRRPDLSRMAGIRRITANNNPMLGDEGAQVLAEALRDDLWLKALDLQACGISSRGARSFLDILNYNSSLVVLDIRRNPLVDGDVLRSVMQRLTLNSSADGQEYKWMQTDQPESRSVKLPTKSRRKATKVLNSSIGKKTTIKSTTGTCSCTCCGRVNPGHCHRKIRLPGFMARREISPIPGLPWRTAARADRFKAQPADTLRNLTGQSDDVTASTTNENVNNNMNVIAPVYLGSPARMRNVEEVINHSMLQLQESHKALDFSNRKTVLIELEQMRRQLQLESLARARADEQVIALTIENQRLKEEIISLRKAQKSSSSYLDDESFLDSVETTFKQFNSFIDMLKEAGLGELVSIAGVDTTQMPIISRSNHINNLHRDASTFAGSKPNGGTNSLYTAASFQSMPVGPSDFGNGHHKPTGQAAAAPGDSSAVASKKAASSTRPELTRSQYLQSSVYDEESEMARLEADELYSLLVKDTLVGIGQADDASEGATGRRQRQTVEPAEVLAQDSERLESGSLDFMRSATRDRSVRGRPGRDSQQDIRDEESDDGHRHHLYVDQRMGSGQADATDIGPARRENDS